MVTTRRLFQEERRIKIAKRMNYMSNDIIIDILSRVPVEDLLRYMCACKSWYNLLKEPFFINLHLHQNIINKNYAFMIYGIWNFKTYSVDCDISFNLNQAIKIDSPFNSNKCSSFSIYGSCNGILLIGFVEKINLQYERICLWNPSTRKCKHLCIPSTRNRNYGIRFLFKYWLGYDLSTDDHKVIRYHYDRSSYNNVSDVYIYSMRTNSCKRIQDVPYFICGLEDPTISKYGEIPLNGAIHWLGIYVSGTIRSKRIVCFDLANDKFKDLQLPDIVSSSTTLMKYWKRLGVLEECLCIYLGSKKMNKIDVFMMKEYGVKESWTKMFSIHDELIQSMKNFDVLCITHDGKIVLHWNYYKYLTLYDPKHGFCGEIKIQGLPREGLRYCHIVTYVKSLVTLEA